MKYWIFSLLYFSFYPILYVISRILIFISTRIAVERHQLKIPLLPRELNSFRIVHLSDFHFDELRNQNRFLPKLFPRLNRSFLNDVINSVNRLNPDMIIMTGDYIQMDPGPIEELCDDFLSKLKCRVDSKGNKLIFASLGNHDIKRDKNRIIASLRKRAGIHVLEHSIEKCPQISPIHHVHFKEHVKENMDHEKQNNDIVSNSDRESKYMIYTRGIKLQNQSLENYSQIFDDGDDFASAPSIEIIGFPDYFDPVFWQRVQEIESHFGTGQNTDQGNSNEGDRTLDIKKIGKIRIILTHNPSTFKIFTEKYRFQFDLMVAGHTHGGQICIPIPKYIYRKLLDPNRLDVDDKCLWISFPVIPLFVYLFNKFPATIRKWLKRIHIFYRILGVVKDWNIATGLRSVGIETNRAATDRSHQNSVGYMYTNRGIGSHPPGRLFCSPEITLFELVRPEQSIKSGSKSLLD